MKDLISREGALMALTGINLPTDRDKLIALFNERIKALPPVEQTEWISLKEAYTKGEWLFEPTQNINNPWKCSCCGHRAGRYKYKTYKFCPWCGAKMEAKGE